MGREPARVLKWVIGAVFAGLAVALTVVLLIVVFQAVTGDWAGGEAGVVWSIAGFVAALTAGAWAIGAGVLLSAKHHRSNRPPVRGGADDGSSRDERADADRRLPGDGVDWRSAYWEMVGRLHRDR